MNLNYRIFLWLLFYSISTSLYSVEVAKAIIVRGQVTANGKSVSKDEWFNAGEEIKTGESSFVKLLFKDNSQVNLAPNSNLIIKQYSAEKSSVLGLIRGQIRSNVVRDPVIDKNKKTKLFIKTATAAIGVRGTDFQVVYNPENEKTLLVTFSGEVNMANVLQADIGEELSDSRLEELISSDEAISVTRGYFSEAGPDRNRASEPVRISPSQLKSLEKNPEYNEEGSTPQASKSFNAPIPPGVDPKLFANTRPASDSDLDSSDNPPEGFFDPKTGKYAPPAGGFIDGKTGTYIAPPPGSTYDPVAKVFIAPQNFGTFNTSTGEYVFPAGFKLNSKGEFVVDSSTLSLLSPEKREKLKGKDGIPYVMTPQLLMALKENINLNDLKDLIQSLMARIVDEADRNDTPEQAAGNSALTFQFIVQ